MKIRVAFIQNQAYEKIGVHQLLAALDAHGIDHDLFIRTLESDFYGSVVDYRPDFLLFSLYIGEERFLLDAFAELKKRLPQVKTMVGGPFTLIFPQIVADPRVDFVIRGDGEEALPALIKASFCGGSIDDVPGVAYVDKRGRLHQSPVVNRMADLTVLPSPNRDRYYKYRALRRRDTKIFIASRGCPHRCSYCYNGELKRQYGGPYWRLRDPDQVYAEIEYVRDRYGLKWVHFQDGTFNADRRWLKPFLVGYRRRQLPPFLCSCRPEHVDEEQVSLLKSAGCERITFGIQSGCDQIRSGTARRRMSKKQIHDAFRLCRKYRIRTGADIIFGWPGETLVQAWETIDLCRKIRADTYHSNVLIPYPGLSLTRSAVKQGYLAGEPSLEEIGRLTTNASPMRQADIGALINMDKLFYLLIRFPHFEGFLALLLRLPPSPFFSLVKNLHLLRRSLKYDVGDTTQALRILRDYMIGQWKCNF